MHASVILACVCAMAGGPRGIVAGAPPIVAPQPGAREPGPLNGGEHGARYLGPGFRTYLPPEWTVTLDETLAGEGARGERGIAKPPPGSAEAAVGATFRFEPYPSAPGGGATLGQYEEFVRRTLAPGASVAVVPLVRATDGFFPRNGGVDGLTFWFTRAPENGGAARRFVVHALPRADGRLQTLICSHEGGADRDASAIFAMVGSVLATEWPDQGGVYWREDLGVVLDCPPGWRPFQEGQCGQFWMHSEAEQRRNLMPVAAFTNAESATDYAEIAKHPRVGLSIVQEFDGVMGPPLIGDATSLFEFADGAAGRMSEAGDRIVVVRIDGSRLLQAGASRVTPSERESVLKLMRGLKLVQPTVEARTSEAKTISALGVSLTYPGEWRLAQPIGRLFAGALTPIKTSERDYAPSLHFGVERLDDLREQRRRWCAAPVQPVNGRMPTVTHEERTFATNSGWEGFQWASTTDMETKKGRVLVRSVWYVLPMPDGVAAVCLSGTTTTLQRGDLQGTWRRIAESVERNTGAPRSPQPRPKQS